MVKPIVDDEYTVRSVLPFSSSVTRNLTRRFVMTVNQRQIQLLLPHQQSDDVVKLRVHDLIALHEVLLKFREPLVHARN